MKNQPNNRIYLFITALIVTAFILAFGGSAAFAAQSDLTAGENVDVTGINPDGRGPGGGRTPTPAGGQLSEAEMQALSFMREEEKLARDVYLTLYDTWGIRVFSSIARSEQSHMDAIANLLAAYNLPDPAAGSEIGEFTNPELQELYDDLIQQGQTSSVDALLVGGLIEEIDIEDLQVSLDDPAVDNADITQVFENLLKGSTNHLIAFAAQYEQLAGVPYVPQSLSQAAYDTLIDSTFTGGSGYGRGGGRRLS